MLAFCVSFLLTVCRSSCPTSFQTPRGSFSARNSSTGSFRRMYKLAQCQISGVKDYMMPVQSGDHRRGIIEVWYSGLQLSINGVVPIFNDTPAAKTSSLPMDAREQLQKNAICLPMDAKCCCKMSRQIPRPVGLKNCIHFCLVGTLLPAFIVSVTRVI